jgi:hypothetical protein
VQAKAGHAQGSTTERYLHAQKTVYPDAAELAEARIFASGTKSGNHGARYDNGEGRKPAERGAFLLPGLDSNQQPSG